jgi:hypothetical protein
MKLTKPNHLVPDRLASIIPRQSAYGMFSEWDTQDCKGKFAKLDEQETDPNVTKQRNKPKEKPFLPFPKGLLIKHRFSFFGRPNLSKGKD